MKFCTYGRIVESFFDATAIRPFRLPTLTLSLRGAIVVVLLRVVRKYSKRA